MTSQDVSGGDHGDGRMHSEVHITGGSFSGPVAFGHQGHATQHNQAGPDAQLTELLQRLDAGLREAGGPEAEAALDDLHSVRSELGQGSPDRPRIIRLMNRIGAAAAPIGSLLELAEHAREMITATLH